MCRSISRFRRITLVIRLVVGKWFSGHILYDRSTNGGITPALGAPGWGGGGLDLQKLSTRGRTRARPVNPLTRLWGAAAAVVQKKKKREREDEI